MYTIRFHRGLHRSCNLVRKVVRIICNSRTGIMFDNIVRFRFRILCVRFDNNFGGDRDSFVFVSCQSKVRGQFNPGSSPCHLLMLTDFLVFCVDLVDCN